MSSPTNADLTDLATALDMSWSEIQLRVRKVVSAFPLSDICKERVRLSTYPSRTNYYALTVVGESSDMRLEFAETLANVLGIEFTYINCRTHPPYDESDSSQKAPEEVRKNSIGPNGELRQE